ncbi:TetR-like C-terminal domain-containing protein [Yinghuangia aomiensis]|uniref:TetR-like C-terminal domain-containing protein n=1 Tax=Yinghuangia aomiensis TaxID=676205 RepID=A0ABP9IIE7_9ACTN
MAGTAQTETPPSESAPAKRPRRRAGLDPDVITLAAVELVDAEGAAALTTKALARKLEVTQPALYAHMENLAAIQRAVGLYGMRAMSEELRSAVLGRSGDEALRALAEAYRDYVRNYPDRFLVQCSAPPSPEYRAAGERAAEAVRAVLRSYGLDEDEVRLAHLSFRATIHGFAVLEVQSRSIGSAHDDAAFEYFLDRFAAGLQAGGGGTRRRSRK